jgi:hypothetical protein
MMQPYKQLTPETYFKRRHHLPPTALLAAMGSFPGQKRLEQKRREAANLRRVRMKRPASE